MKNLVLILPLSPFVSKSGGAVAFLNHLRAFELSDSNNKKTCIIFMGVEENVPDNVYLNKNFPSVSFLFAYDDGFIKKGRLSRLYKWLSSSAPIDVLARQLLYTHPDFSNVLNSADTLIIDHIYSFGVIHKHLKEKRLDKCKKIVYIAHNVESLINKQRMFSCEKFLWRIFMAIDYVKMDMFEKKCLELSSCVVCISEDDMGKIQHSNRVLSTETIFPQYTWNGSESQDLVFIGSSDYYPNRDAINWLCDKLSPFLAEKAPRVRIKIIGKVDSCLSERYSGLNVEFLGFVSKEVLDLELNNAGAFISPVVLGSGIKIKMLEALSRGVPIFCTKESMTGLSSIKSCVVFDRQSPINQICDDILKLISSASCKKETSNDIFKQYLHLHSITKPLECIIDEKG